MQVLVLSVTLRSRGMELPPFAGSVWHGGFGAVLHEEHPKVFDALYQVSDEARLYSLIPPEGGYWPAGQSRVLQVSLFGAACASALAVLQTLVRLGAVGLRHGGHASRYIVERVETLSPSRSQAPELLYTAQDSLLTLPQSSDLHTEWAKATAQCHALGAVTLRLRSPLRIKDQNQDVRVPPTAVQLLRRILSRAEQLAHANGLELAWLREHRHDWLNQAAHVVLADEPSQTHTHWQMLKRYSARTSQTMQFGGLIGQLHYTQVPPAVAAWLLLSQSLQIGGKTAFGFGGVEAEMPLSTNNDQQEQEMVI